MSSQSPGIATFDQRDFPASRIVELKGRTTVSVVIPARNEERTIGTVISVVIDGLIDRLGIVNELVVVDDGSSDETRAVALRAGAKVVSATDSTNGVNTSTKGDKVSFGKGRAMRRGLECTTGDLVVFLDADVTNLRPHFVTGLLGPLLSNPETDFVKGYYDRPFHGSTTGGGRVTELTARPVIALCFPELSGVFQPLAGETAARREVLADLNFEPGYGVEMGLLLDVTAMRGTGVIAQVDLGVRVHRNRSLSDLAYQAQEVLAVALSRAHVIAQ